ncbi:hypothetical protein JGH11_18690 [Dysgonomonas sp. Marseille-P4677]|uniref:DUF7847 domain-containing protein n=1 Tax=Dysgonomonas sp. Marseille-P4677 TaxID=2364790 RepID=UPI001914316B|nr:hypothetical protein [Dysgonomonas sp. Marseille-P4677]MBK5722901.1 hypothetical protein [Dysgonomonas sp. Marseille-P4677]
MKQSEKIKLFGSRDFSGNFDMSVKFIKQNYAPIFKALCYLIPLALIAAYFMPNLFRLYYDIGANRIPNTFNDGTELLGMLIAYPLLLIIMFVISLYTISYMALYVKTEDGVVNSSDVWRKVRSVALPVFGGSILFGIAFSLGYILCLIPGIIVAVYFGFYSYAYINEDLGIIDSFKRSVELVQNNWWITLGYTLAFSFIIGMAYIVFAIPLYIGMIGSMLQVEFLASGITFIIAMMIAFVGYIFLYPAFFMAMGVMYYSHRNKLEGVDMETEIDNIGTYGDSSNNSF